MKISKVIMGCIICFIISTLIFPLVQARTSGVRGRYIYDDADRISTETELSLSSYLLGIDQRTGYEFIVVMPTTKLNESDIIKWFNDHGVGKEKVDTGAALFIFPDNSWFMSIGSGNDKVSVPYSKTQGDRILSNLSSNFALSLLRYIDVIGKRIDEPKPVEVQIFNSVVENSDIIILWILVIVLVALLIQQYDGFQLHDLIIPVIIFLIGISIIGINYLPQNGISTYSDYGIITHTQKTSYEYTEEVAHTYTIDGETYTYYTTEYHTRYTNAVTFKSYQLKDYSWKFESTDSKESWNYNEGLIDELEIYIPNDSLSSINGINDFSGGVTIGDGCWG
jgi:uncharacterized membrane protein YgcG